MGYSTVGIDWRIPTMGYAIVGICTVGYIDKCRYLVNIDKTYLPPANTGI